MRWNELFATVALVCWVIASAHPSDNEGSWRRNPRDVEGAWKRNPRDVEGAWKRNPRDVDGAWKRNPRDVEGAWKRNPRDVEGAWKRNPRDVEGAWKRNPRDVGEDHRRNPRDLEDSQIRNRRDLEDSQIRNRRDLLDGNIRNPRDIGDSWRRNPRDVAGSWKRNPRDLESSWRRHPRSSDDTDDENKWKRNPRSIRDESEDDKPWKRNPRSAKSEYLSIEVYYESLCPDSISFFENQLFPTWQELGDYLTIKFVPFGKASFKAKKDGKGWSFTCQHGSKECNGNKVQSCALFHVTDPKLQVELISCIMSSQYPPSAGERCARKVGVSFDPIRSCADSVKGEELLHDNGVKTKSLTPRLNYVPWITINGQYSADNLSLAQADLKKLVCNNLSPRPTTCSSI